jgi:hypothetical protein
MLGRFSALSNLGAANGRCSCAAATLASSDNDWNALIAIQFTSINKIKKFLKFS